MSPVELLLSGSLPFESLPFESLPFESLPFESLPFESLPLEMPFAELPAFEWLRSQLLHPQIFSLAWLQVRLPALGVWHIVVLMVLLLVIGRAIAWLWTIYSDVYFDDQNDPYE